MKCKSTLFHEVFFGCKHTQKQTLVHTAFLSHSDRLDQVALGTEDLGRRSPEDQHRARPPLDWGNQPVHGQTMILKCQSMSVKSNWLEIHKKRANERTCSMILSVGFFPLPPAPGWRAWGNVHKLSSLLPLDSTLKHNKTKSYSQIYLWFNAISAAMAISYSQSQHSKDILLLL